MEENGNVFFVDCNNPETGEIDIKVIPNDFKEIVFYIKSRIVRIDWGDGNIEDSAIAEGTIFMHKYANSKLKSIKLNTIGMTEFDCKQGCGSRIYEIYEFFITYVDGSAGL